jgi:hypothetical protein
MVVCHVVVVFVIVLVLVLVLVLVFVPVFVFVSQVIGVVMLDVCVCCSSVIFYLE